MRLFKNMRNAATIAAYNFRSWRRNPRIIITFLLEIILCFFLTDKAMLFAKEHGTVLQIMEPFVWTFGDSNSILLVSLLLLLLFADMPFITPATPLFLVRTNRKTWIAGQMLYIAVSTMIYLLVTLGATALLCMTNAFSGNMWSKTAAILGYSGDGAAIAIPALVKTLEMSRPYECMITIFALMLVYTLVMVFIMMLLHILKGHAAGIAGALVFTAAGFLLNPENLAAIFDLPEELTYKARVFVGWISPLNQATYHMHNFGYDRLPTLQMTFLIFGALIAILLVMCFWAVKKYSFDFRGTEG